MQIGKLKFDGKLILAPMAGVSDRALRECCLSFGASAAVSEMVSAKGLASGNSKSRELLSYENEGSPKIIQLFAADPYNIALGIEKALYFSPDIIDLNMGCPAPKIYSSGAGAALLREPKKAAEVAGAAVRASCVPVTVKLRTGTDGGSKVCAELAKRLEDVGVSALTVHGRTAAQGYAPPVDFESIREVKSLVSIPVIGNGDIRDGPSAMKMLELTGCDALMVGRGALGRPWVFYHIRAYLDGVGILPEPPVSERMRVMLSHLRRLCEYKGEERAMLEARKHAVWYIRELKGAARFRSEASSLRSFAELEKLAARIIIAASEEEDAALYFNRS